MPVLDVWEFLRLKMEDPCVAEIHVIVISAVASNFLDGVKAVLRKPVHPEKLVDAVRRHHTPYCQAA